MTKPLNRLKLDKINLEKVFNFLPYPLLVSELINGVRQNIFVNKAFEEEIGFPLCEIPTIDSWFEKAYADTAYRSLIISEWKQQESMANHSGADAIVMQAKINTKSSVDQWYEVKATIHGEIQFVAFMNIDKEIRKEEEMEKLIENKDRILSILSHDLRSPLGNLSSVIQLALDGNLTDDERNSILLKLNHQIFQMQEFLDTTLHWSRSSFEETKIVYRQVYSSYRINSILSLYNDTIERKHIRVTIELRNQVILTDEGIFTIVIRNLISNAIKFTPVGGEVIIREYQQNDCSIVEIQNSGIGIGNAKISAILSGDYISEKGTQGENGLGLGLKLCLQLLTKLQGKMSIESSAGHSTFRVHLPYKG
ncbi:sensor histidine kinase [Ohtaekwangia koreensis]|nr:HAMP domain-containing sensor histidine kinase [Ohtaekwangia koreensis]